MNYTQAVDYIETIPGFTRKHPLEHTKELLARLGDPQESFQVIHVAGTNGKGSVCAYLDSMLRQGGYRVGLFTSPHLVRINERFQVNGKEVSDETFLEAFLRVKQVIEEAGQRGWSIPVILRHFFLWGWEIFRREGIEYLVMETGRGRLDATNAVKRPLAGFLTSISMDHMEYLGNTLEEIPVEKAGIIKPGVPVICDGHVRKTTEVIKRKAREEESPFYALTAEQYRLIGGRDGISFTFQGIPLEIPDIARYQMMNASLAFYTMQILRPVHGIDDEKLQEGIRKVKWPGRMETILPGVIVDGAHNADGVARFVETVEDFRKENRIVLLFSAVADKQYEEIIRWSVKRSGLRRW